MDNTRKIRLILFFYENLSLHILVDNPFLVFYDKNMQDRAGFVSSLLLYPHCFPARPKIVRLVPQLPPNDGLSLTE